MVAPLVKHIEGRVKTAGQVVRREGRSVRSSPADSTVMVKEGRRRSRHRGRDSPSAHGKWLSEVGLSRGTAARGNGPPWGKEMCEEEGAAEGLRCPDHHPPCHPGGGEEVEEAGMKK